MSNKDVFHSSSALFLSLLFLTACSQSPEQKVATAEKRLEALRESSGYNECVRKVEADEKKMPECIAAKVVAAGYTDRLNCIEQYENPICKDTKRYNAEVYGQHDCLKEVKYDTELTIFDCAKLMQE